jgi:hypothetical protein
MFMRDRFEARSYHLGLCEWNPLNRLWEPIQVGDYLSLAIDLLKGELHAPCEKLNEVSN